MTLRLKKIDEYHWLAGEEQITRKHEGKFANNVEYQGTVFYEWDLRNTYKTEYRKMRKALITYLDEQKPKKVVIHPEELVLMEVITDLGKKTEDLTLKLHKEREDLKDALCMIDDLREEKRRDQIEIEKLRKNAEVRDMLINFYKTELASLGWKPSHETAEQSTLITEYKTVQREMGHKHYPKILDLSQIQPGCKLPKGMRR